MKKFATYLLFSATTLHAIIGISPVMAMGCGSYKDKIQATCEVDDAECKEKISSEVSN